MKNKVFAAGRNKLAHKALIDALILTATFVIIYVISFSFDLFENLHTILQENEELELDEIIVVSSIFSIFLTLFSLRRWFDLKQALTERNIAENGLAKTNQELNSKQLKLEQHKTFSEKLIQLTNFLQVCKTREEAFKFISEASAANFPGSSGAIYITRESRNQLSKVAEWGEKQTDFFIPDDCWALRLGKPYSSIAEGDRPSCNHVSAADNAASICTPLTAHGEIIGLFSLKMPPSAERKNIPPEDAFDQSLLMFTEQISLAISNLALHEKLRNLAIRDPLTGLFNRQYLQEMLEREVYRAHRNQSDLAVLMLDLDHFKEFNDTYGHLAGDLLLKELGTLLRTHFRREDFCCRFGGEEFIVLLPDIDKKRLLDKTRLLRENIQELNIVHEGKSLDKVTASIGLAFYPENGKNSSQLIESADKALYRAKKEGRNRVCFAD
ncbi:MAG: diguanylate cyclase [Desulfuromonadaceae bacterium]